MTRVQLMLLSLAAIGSVVVGMLWKASPRIVYNASDSAPLGWYWVQRGDALQVGDYVVAMLPVDVATIAAARSYLAANIPVLKPIAALAGQQVCMRDRQVAISGRVRATALLMDSQHRPLSVWSGCRTLDLDEVFLLSTHSPASFDSRYFGPLDVQQIVGRATALWTWDRQ